MKNINNETCRWMSINGELVPFSPETPDTSNGAVKVKYYLTKPIESLEEEFEGNDYVKKVSLENMDVSKLKSIKNMLNDCTSVTELIYNDNIDVDKIDTFNACPKGTTISGTADPSFIYRAEERKLTYNMAVKHNIDYTMMDDINIAYTINVAGKNTINLNSYTLSNKGTHKQLFNLTEPNAEVTLVYPPGKLDLSPSLIMTEYPIDGYMTKWQNKRYYLVEMTELDKLNKFLSSGSGEYKLQEDISVTMMLYPGVDNLTLDLNGHIISNGTVRSTTANANFILLQVPMGRTFTIKDSVGTGKIDGGGKLNSKSSIAVKVQGGSTLNIESGNFTVDIPDTGGANSCIYVEEGTLNVSGGKFESIGSKNGVHFVLNMLDNSNSTISVTGGEFVDFDPSKPMTEPDKTISFVPEGYTVEQNDNIYRVVEEI